MRRALLGEPELAYERHVYLAVELLDAVTMTRVREGVTVVAEGLKRKPIINGSGFFVWLEEENAVAQKITVDPDELPYEKAELSPLTFPLSTIQLQPKIGYPFTPGLTGLRGTLIERDVTPPVPVGGAEVTLGWLDDSDTWRDAPTTSPTSSSGDFVSILRLAPTEKPKVDANGAVTVRLLVRRDLLIRSSTDFKLPSGRVTDPSTSNRLMFAWDDLQP